MKISKQRDAYLDLVKGIAIIAVVVGHCIQFGSGVAFMQEEGYFYNDIFRFIYSWHMPLFMLVSGYLFSFSTKRHEWKELLKSRFTQLLIPMLSWAALITIALSLRGGDNTLLLYTFAKRFINDIWFLWAIFYNSLIVLLVRKYFSDSLWIYGVVYVLTFITPDTFGAGLYKFMYPFFVIAYLYGMGKLLWISYVLQKLNPIKITLIVAVLYIFLFSMYGYYSYIYTSGYSVVNFKSQTIAMWKLWNDIFRMCIGFAGSVLLLLLIRLIYDRTKNLIDIVWKLLQQIGIASLAIYIISGYMNSYILPKICKNFELNYMITILETVLVVTFCYGGFYLLRKWSVVNRFLLGGR